MTNMPGVQPLPSVLRSRFHGWRATRYAESRSWYQRLMDEGQRPRTMIIACCDSRVQATTIFGAEAGEYFVHRNIANLVPPMEQDEAKHGTSAAIEYAVTALKVTNLLVLGHAQCGGVAGCLDMCEGNAPALEDPGSFVGRWMEILRPAVAETSGEDRAARLRALEKQGVIVSLRNLMTFPFVQAAVEAGELSLHGLWIDMREGVLEALDPETGAFAPV